MRFLEVFVFATLLLSFSSLKAQDGQEPKRRSFPMPPKLKFEDWTRLRLDVDIPYPVDVYDYVVSGSFGGTEFHPDGVPLWIIESRKKRQAGSIPVGESFTFEVVRAIAGRNFFGFKYSVEGKAEKQLVWIDGRFVKIAGPKSEASDQ